MNLIATYDQPAWTPGHFLSTNAIRSNARVLLERARRGESAWLAVDDARLPEVATLVADVTRQNYPALRIPYHSRWRHFEAGGVDRKAWLDAALAEADGSSSAAETARMRIDLTVVSVLLDAGAGPGWRFAEAQTGQSFSRSEGLGVASLHAFMSGLFSSDPARPLRVDAQGLQALTEAQLAAAFQVSPANPLVGLEGRTALLQHLGAALAARPDVFGNPARPGGLFDVLTSGQGGNAGSGAPVLEAHSILRQLLTHLGPIWLAGNTMDGADGPVAVGDCWPCPAAPGGWMPFHKLSQWLTYSLLEPFEWAGITVTGLGALTGLPEYRNGGLLLDGGVLQLKDPAWATKEWLPGDPLVVEWRALTVALLDDLAPLVRAQLGLTEAQMPLACVLEGGTWAAGRVLAQRLRGGTPPLNITSDGTVF
jgi:hypothetical protein